MDLFIKLFSVSIFASTLRIATPLILAALGGCMSERSGVINIGLEGMMLMGAFTAVVGSFLFGPWVGLLMGVCAGGLMGLLHAFMSVTLGANQIISGTAINIIAVGIPNILVPVIWPGHFGISPTVPVIPELRIPFLADIPVIGRIFGKQNPVVYIALILVPLIHFLLFRTRLGLRIRSVGEHPRAADTLGVNVYRMRYIAVAISGLLAASGILPLHLLSVAVFGVHDRGEGIHRAGGHDFRQVVAYRGSLGLPAFRLRDAFQRGPRRGRAHSPRPHARLPLRASR